MKTDFALLLNAWRRTRGWTHRELAAKLGISSRTSEAYTQGQCFPAEDVLATLRRMGFPEPAPKRRGPGRPEVSHV